MIIFDTDPGLDDMMALLLLMTTPKSVQEFKMISLSFGNCSLEATLHNVLSMLYVIEKENETRKAKGEPLYSDQRPIISLGSSETIDGVKPKDATDVHGNDGLGGIHQTNPEFDAPKEWVDYFLNGTTPKDPESLPFIVDASGKSWETMNRILKEEPEDSVTVCSVGPLTNVCHAIQDDPAAFSRVKQVLSMGAAINVVGNVTPTAEFNVYADPVAAARVYAWTSSNPKHMLPSGSPEVTLPRPINLILFPLDITNQHELFDHVLNEIVDAKLAVAAESTMAQWSKIWINLGFENIFKITGRRTASISLHDPLTAMYAIQESLDGWKVEYQDVRVEAQGQWCQGMTVIDKRGRARLEDNPHDFQKWLTKGEGNNVGILVDTPVKETFAKDLVTRIVYGTAKN